MPFDGFVTRYIAGELNDVLAGGRIDKIGQPERDEIHITVRSRGRNHRLLISANASAARIHLTESAAENPASAPMFCMILRKHLGGGRILGVSAKDLERVVEISVESANELGDISVKTLIAELMGKHSNIILINSDNRVINALVHVDQDMSRVREVMPARPYTPPPAQNKLVPLAPGAATVGDIIGAVSARAGSEPAVALYVALLDAIMGASPLFCREVCHRAGLDAAAPISRVGEDGYEALGGALADMLDEAAGRRSPPCVILRDPPPVGGVGGAGVAGGMGDAGRVSGMGDSGGSGGMGDASRVSGMGDAGVAGGIGDAGRAGRVGCAYGETETERALLDYYCGAIYGCGSGLKFFDTMSGALDEFYARRARAASLAQRKAGIAKAVGDRIARCKKKLAIQLESVREAENGEKYKLYGELVTANIHAIGPGATSVRLLNYYGDAEGGEEYVDIGLAGELSPQANAQIFFKKYRKAMSTRKHAQIQAGETAAELEYLESVLLELEMAQDGRDIDEIRQELASQAYMPEGRGARAGGAKARDGRADRGGPGSQGGFGGQGGRVKQGGGRGGQAPGKAPGKARKAPPGRKDAASQPHAFISSDGLDIFVGKNNRQNDQLTLRTASSNDVWLHTRAVPGSHVIIRKGRGDVPDGTLLEAASLAAYFSAAKMSGNVHVDYTIVKHVKKPSGAKPGMVIYDNYRTLTVKPDESLPARLAGNRRGPGPGANGAGAGADGAGAGADNPDAGENPK